MQEIQQLWNKVLSKMEMLVTVVSFDLWIKTIELIDFREQSILVLVASSTFAKNQLNKNHLAELEECVEAVFGENVKFEILDSNEKEKYLKDNKPSDTQNVEQVKDTSSDFNEKYTFDNFVVGKSNQFVYAAARNVAENPGKSFNPLFIYGGVGLGKTHLMHAIGHYIKDQNNNANVLYISSEKFTNELINSIKDDKNEEFRNRYRNVDVLLIDDIQFIAGKERTQEEFFHTFNALHEANKQIIISSDRPPKEIPTLEDRLRSRFEWGLTTDIQAPDFETRIAILRKKAESENYQVNNEVFDFIARKIKSNIRELEGALTRVTAYSSLTNKDVSVELAQEALKDIISSNKPKQVNIDMIKDVVAQHYNVQISDFDSKRRTRSITYPRQVAMYLSRELTDLSLPKIGEGFGGRDHTTVIHAYDKISHDINENSDLKEIILQLRKTLINE